MFRCYAPLITFGYHNYKYPGALHLNLTQQNSSLMAIVL